MSGFSRTGSNVRSVRLQPDRFWKLQILRLKRLKSVDDLTMVDILNRFFQSNIVDSSLAQAVLTHRAGWLPLAIFGNGPKRSPSM